MMVSLLDNLTPETYDRIFSEWLGIIKRRECGSIIHLPKRDQLYRVHALLQSNLLKPYHYILLDLTAHPIEDSFDLERFIRNQMSPAGKKTVLLILDADMLVDERITLISGLNNLYHQIPVLSILYFFGKNITYPSLAKQLSNYTTLYQNVHSFPYLEHKDSYHFVRYLEKKLDTNIPVELVKKIVDACGGIPWLIKQACRYWSKTEDVRDIFNHEEMRIKIDMLIDEFLIEERQILEKILKQNFIFNHEEQIVLNHLLKTNTLVKKGRRYEFFSPLLENQLKKQLTEKLKIEALNGHDLVINGVAVNRYFSKRERFLLVCLLNKKGEIIDRETAAKTIWKDQQESYSDWALDQFILRLRKKLINLGFQKDFIKTVKNKGFILL